MTRQPRSAHAGRERQLLFHVLGVPPSSSRNRQGSRYRDRAGFGNVSRAASVVAHENQPIVAAENGLDDLFATSEATPLTIEPIELGYVAGA